MIATQRRLRLSGWLIGLVLCFIWGNSLLSREASEAFSLWVKSLLDAIVAPGGSEPGQGLGLLRKMAHFTEFAALGACLSWRFGMLEKRKRSALLLGFGAACVDETIQLFVPDRGPAIRDVVIDTCGVAAGMVILLLIHKITTTTKSKENKQL